MQYMTYHDLLDEEFTRRKLLNSSYSLRAFARDLGIAAPRLSLILNKKEGLSVKTAAEIANRLKLPEEKKEWFCNSVGSLHARSVEEKNKFRKKILQHREEVKCYHELHFEYFKVIADWFHFAILELTYLTDFRNDSAWIAEKLGIKKEEVETALERMKKLELIVEKDGRLVDPYRVQSALKSVPASSLKKFNSQLMKKALSALLEQSPAEHEIASTIFSVRKDRLPVFREKLRNLLQELEQEASQQNDKDAVFCLSLQLYELTTRKI